QNDKSKYYSQLYTQLNDSLRYAERSVANTSLKKIITKKEIAYKKNKQIISIISGGILALFLLFILFWKRKNKLIHKKYEVLLEKIQNERKKNISHQNGSDLNSDVKYSVNITDETANNLLIKLEKFESSDKYLRKDISLTWLANHLNTNTKYLSEIIKIHKNKTFSNYINGLRINYIVHKLVEEPLYREYKINYLAEECGYASRQVFIIAFKKETGFTPSYFIENLNKTS